ncbi:protein kinase [Haematococcus lacustris]
MDGPQLRLYSAAELSEATAGFSQHCLIGSGGFGKVYRAMVNLTPVAIKVLDHEGLQGLREFHNEMKILAGLYHPHIVGLLGYAAEQPSPAGISPSSSGPQAAGAGAGGAGGEAGAGGVGGPRSRSGMQALVYELMTRGNLEELLACKSPGSALSWAVRLRIAAQVACAVAFLHSKDIIHRDIKPANVFLTADLHAKLGDIGLAVMDNLYHIGRGGRGAEENGEAVGTWQYLAPEYVTQSRGRISSSSRTDTYAYGLTLLQLLTGSPSPKELVRRAQAALESAQLPALLDTSAGPWDMRAAQRAVKLALWCCMHAPDSRPQMATVHAELHRLASAAAQCSS